MAAAFPNLPRRKGKLLIGLLAGLLLLASALILPAGAAASQVYVTGSGATGNAVSPFSVGANGSLTPISCGSSCATGAAPIGVAMSPNGQYLYTSTFTPNKVSVFSVAAGGSLTPVTCSGTNCNTGAGPYGIALTPSGQYLYTANNTGNTVSAFSIGSGGALTPITCSGTNCNTGTKPYGVAVTPNGQYLYTANNNSNTVSAFSIGANGSLTPITCSGSNCTTGSQPEGIAVSPNGQYLYTANRGTSSGAISVFSIASNGSLTPVACGTGCNWGTNGAFSLAISSNGQYLYATIRNATSKVATFSIGSNGVLSPITCSGSNCNVGASAGGVAVSPNNQYVYASSFTASNVSPYLIGANGSLTPISCTSPNCNTAAGPDFQSVVVSPDQAPTAAFTATAARPGQASSFNGSGSTASAGQTVARYDWNYGDGQSASNAGPTPTHAYAAEGDYDATLTVTDNAGCSTTRTFTGQTVSCNGSSVATTTQTVSVDGTPPNTLIDSAAHGSTGDTTPTFDFHATESGSSFECSIDTGTANWGACSGSGTHTPPALSDGDYTFRVRATDAQGNTDQSPAAESFSVDTTPPNTLIDSAAHGATADTTPTFDFHASESGSSFECSIDTGSASWGACSGPGTHTPSVLSDGDYTFRVRATDAQGNTDQSPATESFTVDTASPDTLIDSAPHGTSSKASPTFDFHSTESGSSFECSIDGGTPAYGPCSGPGASHSPSVPLPDGDYTFRVRAADSQGNLDQTPATETFAVDTTAPDTLIDSAPHGTTTEASPSFDFHSTESGSSFECSIDTGTANWGPCSGSGTHSPPSPLSDGDYTFRVRATDAQGNTDQMAATESFTVATAVTDTETSCPAVAVTVANYTPSPAAFAATAAGDLGPTVPGVRAKVTIDEPSRLMIAARIRWMTKGHARTVDLGARTITSQGTRNLRLALPRSLADELPRGTPVTLSLRITARPSSAPGCSSPSVERLTLKTEVIKVLASAARLKFKPHPPGYRHHG